MKLSRLSQDPLFNLKRRKGTGGVHLPKCPTCGYRIPSEIDSAMGAALPCSEFHTRCVRCHWPIDKKMVGDEGLCITCMNSDKRRQWLRKRKEEEMYHRLQHKGEE